MTTKESSWESWVMPKAKDLIQSGAITMLTNTPQYIRSHVVGYGSDNDPEGTPDEHEVAIYREDPTNPLKISMWDCDCEWARHAWGRTKQWKKFNGRMCSHAIATLWQSLSTPQDLSEQQPGYQVPRGQKAPTEPGQMAPTWEQQQMQLPGLEQEGPAVTQQPEFPAQPEPTPFRDKVPHEPPQRQQLYLWDLTSRPGEETPAQFVPIPPEQRTPTLQMPGAFSSVQVPRFRVVVGEFNYGAKSDDFTTTVQEMLNKGRTPVVQILRPVELEPRGGKQPMPGAQPYDVNAEGTPVYTVDSFRQMDLGYDPAQDRRVRADEPPAGAPEWRGQSQTAQPGKRGIILSVEPTLKWAFISVPLHLSGPLHAHSLEGFVSYSDIKLLPGAEDPYRAGY